MESFENLAVNELKLLAKARIIDGYKNMSRQQLESIFTTPSPPKPTPKSKPRPKKRMPASISAPRPKKLTPTPTPRLEIPLSIPRDYKQKKIADNKYIDK